MTTNKNKVEREQFEEEIKMWPEHKLVCLITDMHGNQWQRALMTAELLERGSKTPTPEDWEKYTENIYHRKYRYNITGLVRTA
jgi:hypothetical protein